MEHGANKIAKLLHSEMTIKTEMTIKQEVTIKMEVEEVEQSSAHFEIEMDLNSIKRENENCLDSKEILSTIEIEQEVHSQEQHYTIEDNKKISCKYCSKTLKADDYEEAHVKSCLRHQKGLRQHQAMSSNGFKSDMEFHKPHLLSAQNKQHQQNNSKAAVTSRSIAGSSKQSRKETPKAKQKPLVCDDCGKGYCTKAALRVHKRLHSGIKLYMCHICDSKFGAKSHYVHHIRTHTGERPYSCDKCDAKFAQSGDLTTHTRVHTGDKPYKCDTCNARFAQSSNLAMHKRVHTGEKPYQCDMCDARFARNNVLTRHVRVHTGEKPYQCDTCDARFAHRNAFTKHAKAHMSKTMIE